MTLNALAEDIYRNAKEHGFWPEEGRNFGEMLMLAVSELSEALEEHRAGQPNIYFLHSAECAMAEDGAGILTAEPNPDGACTCYPKPEGTATEIVDCIIRCLDTLRSLGVDIDRLTQLKMAYNASRPFKHGKAY